MTSDSEQKPIFTASQNDVGQRVDNYLLKNCKQLNKSSCYKLIRKGQIRINGKRIKPQQKLAAADQIRVPPYVFFVDRKIIHVPGKLQQQLLAQVIFEDDNYLAIDKPAGMPCHKGTGHDFGVIEILTSITELKNLQLGHRLDRDTSGCLLLAKSRQSLLLFQQALKKQQVTKLYVAVLSGQLLESISVNQPLDTENRVNGIRHVIPSASGQSAQTLFQPLSNNTHLTLAQCQITSGRTHQIRAHAKFIGHAVLGDHFYGANKQPNTNRQMYLHAMCLQFGDYQVAAKLPSAFEQVMSRS